MSTTHEAPEDNGLEEVQDVEPTMTQSILRSMFGLGLFAIFTAGVIVLTQQTTEEQIIEQKQEAKLKALVELVPLDEHDNDLLKDAFFLTSSELSLAAPEEVYVARKDGQGVAIILPVIAPNGYSGNIKLIVGVNLDGTIKGVRAVEHKETPGLGDKIETKKSDWIHAFVGRSLANTSVDAWRVRKDGGDFDQMTGATITPRAVVNSVHHVLEYYTKHKQNILTVAPGSTLSFEEVNREK